MSALWSNAAAGVWAGKLGSLGSDPREGSEWCFCSSCARPTTMTGTKLCDRCWETQRTVNQPGNELYAAAQEMADALEAWVRHDSVPALERDLKWSLAHRVIHEDARAALRKAGRLS